MKTSLTITDSETEVLLAPECETDVRAIRLLCIVNGAALVRRTIKGVKTTCLLIRMEDAKKDAELEFDAAEPGEVGQ
jgi:hypothetical protein